jgi:hypothetical protein
MYDNLGLRRIFGPRGKYYKGSGEMYMMILVMYTDGMLFG